jgi:hypothetical protein
VCLLFSAVLNFLLTLVAHTLFLEVYFNFHLVFVFLPYWP